jgi:hypothetical protein
MTVPQVTLTGGRPFSSARFFQKAKRYAEIDGTPLDGQIAQFVDDHTIKCVDLAGGGGIGSGSGSGGVAHQAAAIGPLARLAQRGSATEQRPATCRNRATPSRR